MKFYTLLLVLALGCNTTPEGEHVPDWSKIDAVGDLVINQLDSQILLRVDDPDAVADLTMVRDVAVLIDKAVEAVKDGEGSIEDVESYLDAATAIIKQLQSDADPEDSNLIATLSGIQGGVDLIRILIA